MSHKSQSVKTSRAKRGPELDLSVIELVQVRTPLLRLRALEPLRLTPMMVEPGQLMSVERSDLDIHVFAPTREQLVDDLHEQVAMLWEEYAREADENLSAPARALKLRLLSAFEEVSDAQG